MLKNWLVAFRLRTLPLALSCIGMGSFLAAFWGQMDWAVLWLSLLTTLLLQVLSNLANDYGDSTHGADHAARLGPKRTVQEGLITPAQMKRAMLICALLSFASGIALLYAAFDGLLNLGFVIFLLMGLLAIGAAIKYTAGRNPYGYAGLGDVSVLIFFGLLGVMGVFYLHTQQLEAGVWLPALSCGLFATGVLNVNNIRDIQSDQVAGKRSIPVRIGRKAAVAYHWVLLGSGFVAAVVFVALHYHSPWQWLFMLTLPLFLKNGLAVQKKLVPSQLDPYLKQLALSTMLFVVTFGVGLLMG